MIKDPEINALANVHETLKGLNNAQIKRIMDWVTSKFDLDKQPGLKASQKEVGPSSQPVPVPGEAAEPAVKTVKERRGRKPGPKKRMVEETQPQPLAGEGTGFMEHDTFQDLFFSSNAKTITAKILLAAAYLQEKKNIKEFGSSDVNALLKKIGQLVPNISASINNLMMKKPPLLIQTGKLGNSKQSRRTYSVTEEGLRIARNYIRT
jgi:DNA-binding MarR family transcriptional regulator